MWLIRAALRRPITILVIVVALGLSSILALARTRIDIFPGLDLPVIYVAQPYGGMSPQQMEGFIAYYYEYHFLYVNGIENVEAKSIQGTALLRLTFHPGTDMSQALAQTISYVNRIEPSCLLAPSLPLSFDMTLVRCRSATSSFPAQRARSAKSRISP